MECLFNLCFELKRTSPLGVPTYAFGYPFGSVRLFCTIFSSAFVTASKIVQTIKGKIIILIFKEESTRQSRVLFEFMPLIMNDQNPRCIHIQLRALPSILLVHSEQFFSAFVTAQKKLPFYPGKPFYFYSLFFI